MTTPKLSELDARIAVIDGWTPAAMPAHPTAYNDVKDVPRYSSSLDALAPVVKKTLKERRELAWELAKILEIDTEGAAETAISDTLQATPREICLAILECYK